MIETTAFGIGHLAAAQAQKHVTVNAGLDHLDALMRRAVISATTDSPASPAEGDAYIVPAGGVGSFGDAAEGDLAIRTGAAWAAVQAPAGFSVLVIDRAERWISRGDGAWTPGTVISPLGQGLGLGVAETTLAASGASVTAAGLIPSRVILLGVTSWVPAEVTGATSYAVGWSADVNAFGSGLGVAAGSSNVGVVGPTATYAAEDVTVTAAGGLFTGGEIALAAAIIRPGPAPV
ncbi:MAG: DUF2793 domain-containing protein [Pseudomonadota bacterium]